jgi:hypothetical protein
MWDHSRVGPTIAPVFGFSQRFPLCFPIRRLPEKTEFFFPVRHVTITGVTDAFIPFFVLRGTSWRLNPFPAGTTNFSAQ